MRILFLLPITIALFTFTGCGGTKSEAKRDSSGSVESSRTGRYASSKSESSKTRSYDKADLDVAESDSSTIVPDRTESILDERAKSKRDDKPTHSRERYRPQSGILTAGSFDDNANYESFSKFVTSILNHPHPYFRQVSLGQRIVIQITNSAGKPVGNSRVVVQSLAQYQQQSSRTLLDTKTASDGRVVFSTGFDGGLQEQEFAVSVYPFGSDALPTVHTDLCSNSETRTIVLPTADSAMPSCLDLALVIDTTGSMGDELEYLKSEIDSIVMSVNQLFPHVDQRYSLVVYRDRGDQYVTRKFDFTGSLEDFRQNLHEQFASGGGDEPEAMNLALNQAARLEWRDDNTARVLFLVGDAPPHQQDTAEAIDSCKKLRERGVRIFPIAGSGVHTEAEIVMRTMSFLTMGQYLFLTDHSGVGNSHAVPHIPEYQVERLDRLMIRMVASELSGRKLSSQELLTLESGTPINRTRQTNSQSTLSFPRPIEFQRRHHVPGKQMSLPFIYYIAIGYTVIALFAIATGCVFSWRAVVRHRSRIIELPIKRRESRCSAS